MVKRIALIASGVILLLFSMIFGFQTCSYSSFGSPINQISISENRIYGEEFADEDDYKLTKDENFLIGLNTNTLNSWEDQYFTCYITKKGLHNSTNEEIEIPLFRNKTQTLHHATIQDVIDSEAKTKSQKYYVNWSLHGIGIPFTYYDYIDKFTYSADKGYSVYFGEDYPSETDINWDNLRIINSNTGSYELCLRKDEIENDNHNKLQPIYFNVYITDGNGGYIAFNQAARDTEARLAEESFFTENIGYIILTAIHAILMFLLIGYVIKHRKNEYVGNKIMSALMLALSIGFQIYGMITRSMDSPYIFGSTLFSVFAFLMLIWIGEGNLLKSLGCLAAAIIEYIVYSNIYSSSNIDLLRAYHMGAIFALCAFVGTYILMFTVIEDSCEFPEAECIWQWILFALLCVICIFSIIIGAFWVGLISLIFTFLGIIGGIIVFLCMCGGGGYVIYIIFE